MWSTMKAAALLAFAMALACGGCASGPNDAALEADARMGDVRDDLLQVRRQVEAMQVSLNDLVFSPAADLTPQFAAFQRDFDATVSAATIVRDRAAQMDRVGDVLLARWIEAEQGLDTEAAKARSIELRRELGRERVAMNEAMSSLHQSFAPYMQDLYDTLGFLKVNLNPDGITDIREMAEQSNIDSKEVLSRLDQAVARLDALRNRYPAPSRPG